MLIVLLRTLILYFSLILFLRLMGKRQVGELDISELVSALLLSEIVAMPIENAEIPLSSALIPMLTIISLEIILSFSVTKSNLIKRILTGSPSILIKKGELDIEELSNSRMSVEELMSELRLKGIGDINEVYYAMLEQNGQISVIQKRKYSPQTPDDTGLAVDEVGIGHTVIVDGHIKKNILPTIDRDVRWIQNELSKRRIRAQDVFLMSVNDNEEITIIMKGKK